MPPSGTRVARAGPALPAAALALPLLLPLLLLPAATAYDNGAPLSALPPMGWNTWCTDDFCGLLDLCFESEIHEVADAMVASGMVAAGYRLIELDDCWASTSRGADGNLVADPARFPSGIAALASYVEARGMVLGLYTSAGAKTCKYGRPGSEGFYDVDARWFAREGVRFVKADNCGVTGSSREVFSNLSFWLNATGVPLFFSTCQWGEDAVWTWGASVAQSFRINQDHLPCVRARAASERRPCARALTSSPATGVRALSACAQILVLQPHERRAGHARDHRGHGEPRHRRQHGPIRLRGPGLFDDRHRVNERAGE